MNHNTKNTIIFVIGIIMFATIIGLVIFGVATSIERYDEKMELYDKYCVEKGYDKHNYNDILKEGGYEFISCFKRNVSIDENGIGEFDTVMDWVEYKP